MNISRILLISLFLAGVGLPLSAAAITPEEKGLAIAVEDDKRDNGFHDYKASTRNPVTRTMEVTHNAMPTV